MKKNINYIILICICLAIFLVLNVFLALPIRASSIAYISAQSAIVTDGRAKKILYAKGIDLAIPPASTAKLMTAIIVLENAKLNKFTTVSRRAANTEASRAGLKIGVRYRIGDLLAASIMASSNDASVVLAESICGTEKEFVKLMNRKAKRIGMKNTQFANSTGLPSKKIKQYSTVSDLAKLMRYALRKPLIVELLNTKTKYITGTDNKKILLKNHNKMLWRKPDSIIGKTGYTIKSRHCFVGMASSKKKRIIFAILSAEKPWQDISILVNHGLNLK